jgi:hypothetical protein
MPDEIGLKIERANKHIEELHGVVQKFKATQPYKVASKRDPQSGEHIVYVHTADDLPPMIPVIAGDVIQNLYCSLDYLASNLVTANGRVPTTKTAFPITEHVPATEKQIARYEGQVCGMREEAKRLLKFLNPYRGEDNLFWTLHKLNNINKHRSLVAMGFQPSILFNAGWTNFGALKQGSEIARFPADFENHKQVNFIIDIAVNEPETDAVHQPLILVLRGCYNLVRRTVRDFDIYR